LTLSQKINIGLYQFYFRLQFKAESVESRQRRHHCNSERIAILE
jgi:hypothetical protein